MKGYEMCRTKGKEPLQQWSRMYHQSGGSSTQVSRIHLSFSYPVPPYMYLRMIVRKEIVFTPRAVARNNIPSAQSPGWDQKVMLSSEERTSSGDAQKRLKKHGHREKERLRNTENNDEESSYREGDTLSFQHSFNYKVKVTDKMGKQLCKGDSMIIAKPSNSNKDTLDIHTYSFVGPVPQKLRPTVETSSILEKFLEDDMSRSVLEDVLGGSESLSELENLVHDSKSFSRIERLPEAPAPHPNMARLWEYAVSSPTSRVSPKALVIKVMRVLGRANRIGVALSLSGTNSYLACSGTPPSLTLETHEKAPENVDDDSGKRILFWLGIEDKWITFESVLHQGYYLCTHKDGSPSSLELWEGTQLQQAINEFQVSP